jgi:hypothetical protein
MIYVPAYNYLPHQMMDEMKIVYKKCCHAINFNAIIDIFLISSKKQLLKKHES